MLAGIPVLAEAVAELAGTVRAVGAVELADRLERAVADEVKLLALTIDERAIILGSLEDPPEGLAERRAVLSASTSGDNGKGSVRPLAAEQPLGIEERDGRRAG